MSRINRLQENSIPERLKQVRIQFDALKGSQRRGSDSVIVRRLATGNTIDFSTTFGYHAVRCWELTITPTDQTFPNSCFVWHVFWVQVSTSGSGTGSVLTEAMGTDANGVRKERLYIMGTTPAATATWNMRYVVYTIGNANLSIAQIT